MCCMAGNSTNPAARVSRGRQARSEQRRTDLIDAGLHVLATRGWSALTKRAVADQAAAPPGLVHYHFGDQSALKRAIAHAAVEQAFAPVLETLRAATTWEAGVAAVINAATDLPRDAAKTHSELLAAAVLDPDAVDVVREALATARVACAEWLESLGRQESMSLATATIALLDGILLHQLIDRDLPTAGVVEAIQSGLVERSSEGIRAQL